MLFALKMQQLLDVHTQPGIAFFDPCQGPACSAACMQTIQAVASLLLPVMFDDSWLSCLGPLHPESGVQAKAVSVSP